MLRQTLNVKATEKNEPAQLTSFWHLSQQRETLNVKATEKKTNQQRPSKADFVLEHVRKQHP